MCASQKVRTLNETQNSDSKIISQHCVAKLAINKIAILMIKENA